eukprot:TRINITY_DN3629_c0_g1_i5.p1 TRINITY_DN3629_c0_g1~~TRINITY_DN3629_c0_g1_i5.p1  ORF type:complete len:317 (+),score=59.61 TRINITY_DN3629_c0_g1_i5:55-1005(+)
MAEIPTITVKWAGQQYQIEGLEPHQTVLDLKVKIMDKTGVKPERQKLLNLKIKGKPANDNEELSALGIKPNFKIMMMGSLEQTIKDTQTKPENIPEVVNDFDIEEEEIAIENNQDNLNKIQKRVRDYEVKVLGGMREGKKLLVLDIDYTLFDHKSPAEQGKELMRPFLHEFLETAYEYYDICIWSATNMLWIEEKMKLLGCTTNPNYKLGFYLDSRAMISISTPKYGIIDVKPLGVIWGKYPQYSPKNTIMFDDLRRNFLMNPQSGLKIRAFREAHKNRDKDRELVGLSKYLTQIAKLEDFTVLRHSSWEKYSGSN